MRLSRRATVGILLTGSSLSITGNFLATEALAARKRPSSNSSPAAASKKPAVLKPGADGAAGADAIRYFVNIKTDYGAVGDGVTDDSQAFAAVSTDYQGQDLYLYLPPGVYHIPDHDIGPGGALLSGMSKLDIWGYGASWTVEGSNLIWWGGGGEFYFEFIPDADPVDVVKSYIEDAEEGEDTVRLVTPADASKWSVGDWVLVCGLQLESGGFEPHNCHHFDFRKITGISGANIELDRALADGPYLTTYPQFDDVSRVPGLGPGIILKMKSDWDCEVTVRGMAFTLAEGEDAGGPSSMQVNARVVRLIDCDFTCRRQLRGSADYPARIYYDQLQECSWHLRMGTR